MILVWNLLKNQVKESLPFLHVKVKLSKGKICTDLYGTDRHQYLHYTSSNPNHNVIPMNVKIDYAAVAKDGVRFVLILLKRILLQVLLTKRHITLIICLNVVKNVYLIS